MTLDIVLDVKVKAEYDYGYYAGLSGDEKSLADFTPRQKEQLGARLADIGQEISEVVETFLRGKYGPDYAREPMYSIEVAYPVQYTAEVSK